MPTYVYKFVETGETIEVQQAFTDASLTEFAHPGSGDVMAVKKVFTPVGVTFKGSGFFKTDNRGKKVKTETSASDSKPGDAKSGDAKSGDSKSGDATAGSSSSSSDNSSTSKDSGSNGSGGKESANSGSSSSTNNTSSSAPKPDKKPAPASSS